VHPTFTTTAALLALGVVVLWLSVVLDRDSPAPWTIAAVVVGLVVAGLVRSQIVLLILGIGLPAALVAGVSAREFLTRRSAVVAGPLLLGLLLILTFDAYDDHVYRTTAGWSEYHELHGALAEFVDYQRVVYTPETRAIFERVGWSPTDLAMLLNYFFVDAERFSLDKMKTVLAAFPKTGGDRASMRSALYFFLNDPYRNAMLATILAATLFVPLRGPRWAVVAVMWIVLLGLTGYLLVVLQRYPPRVYQPLLAFAAAATLVLVDGVRDRRRRRRLPVILGSVMLIVVAGLTPSVAATWAERARLGARFSDGLARGLAELASDEKRLYVVWAATLPLEFTPPFSDMDEFRALQFVRLASETRAPYNSQRLVEFGIDDLHRAIYMRDDVFVIANDDLCRLFVAYVAEHYGERIAFRPVARYGVDDWHLFSVFRFEAIGAPLTEPEGER
jgi:hypothetical protein